MAFKNFARNLTKPSLENREIVKSSNRRWLSHEELKEIADALASITNIDVPLRVTPRFPKTSMIEDKAADTALDLLPASYLLIDSTIGTAYDEADKRGMKPPNLKEIIGPVQNLLRTNGYQASGRRIQQIADKHKNRRRKPGVTVSSEKRRQRQ